MTDNDTTSTRTQRASLVERRARRIANARSVVFGLAGTFVGLALAGAALMRLADPTNFPSFGLAVWWALQTVTTVGYGDVVPTTTAGRLLGGVEMVLGGLRETLARNGVEAVDPKGEKFDPTKHEALSTQPVEETESGIVIETLQKGYRLGDQLVRPARVVVSA